MQSKRLNRRQAALAVALTLLLTTPVLAVPAAAGEPSSSGFPGWEAVWDRVGGVVAAWFGPNGAVDARSTVGASPVAIDRISDKNGAGVDPNGSPEPTSSWTGGSKADAPSSTGMGRSDD